MSSSGLPGETASSGCQPHGADDLRKLTPHELKLLKTRVHAASSFDDFKIQDPSYLDECAGRARCDSCGQSRMYFCYTCHLALPRFRARTPRVQLPCSVDILKHPREVDGKSTAIHAAILAPQHATVYTHPHIPDYATTKEKVILIFPGPNSVKLEDLFSDEQSCCSSPCTCGSTAACSRDAKKGGVRLPFDRVVLIDCTWNQVKRIVLDPRVAGLPRVELSQHSTLFWRYQTGKPNTYLATIEALYYFLLDLHTITHHRTAARALQEMPLCGKDGCGTVTCPDDERDVTNAGTWESGGGIGEKLASVVAGKDGGQTDSIPKVKQTINSGDEEVSAEESSTIGASHQPTYVTLSATTAPATNSTDEQHEAVPWLCDEFINWNFEDVFEAEDTPPTPQLDYDSVREACLSDTAAGEVVGSSVAGEDDELAARAVSGDCVAGAETSSPGAESSLFIQDCCHQYDNLLFFFKFMFFKIHNMYGTENLRAYK